MSKRILIIENQSLQYELLLNGLNGDKYVISPSSRRAYESLISAVKVYVNEAGYPDEYREACFDVIKQYCVPERDSAVDLIIMDYKLGGSTTCKTGYDLAFDIWKKIDKRIVILFLSRTDYADENSFEKRVEMENSNFHFDWLMKGFIGEETMQAFFVEKNVRKKIEQMFEKHWPIVSCANQEYIDIIDSLLSKSNIDESDKNALMEMRVFLANLDDRVDEQTPFVQELKKRGRENRTATRGDLTRFFNELKESCDLIRR